MVRHWMSLIGAGSLVALAVAFALPPRQEEDLKAQVGALQKELKAQVAAAKSQEQAAKELERRVVLIEGWFRGLPTTIATLDAGLQETEASGFTNAGANPKAREVLLATLRSLGQGLKANAPAVAPAPAK